MAKDRYKKGSWNVIDDVSGFKKKGGDLRKRWDGVMVTEQDWEPRHPQDFLRIPAEDTTPPFVRPATQDYFIYSPGSNITSTINETTINGFLING